MSLTKSSELKWAHLLAEKGLVRQAWWNQLPMVLVVERVNLSLDKRYYEKFSESKVDLIFG